MSTRAPLLLALITALGACGGAQSKRGYPAPKPTDVVAHLQGLHERATSLKAETKTDFRLGDDRVNLTVMMLGEWGGKLRFQAMNPNDSLAADLATDGKRYCFMDVRRNCAECGEATPRNVARMVRIPLAPDDVVTVLLGGTPLLAGGDNASLDWDASAGADVLKLTAGPCSQRVLLDQQMDVLDSEVSGQGCPSKWRVQHKDFHEVKTTSGQGIRLPGRSLFSQADDSVRIIWKEQTAGAAVDESKFSFTPPAGLPKCP